MDFGAPPGLQVWLKCSKYCAKLTLALSGPGSIFDDFLEVLGALFGTFGGLWGASGHPWGTLGPLWGTLGAFWEVSFVKSVSECIFAGFWGPPGGPKGASRRQGRDPLGTR